MAPWIKCWTVYLLMMMSLLIAVGSSSEDGLTANSNFKREVQDGSAQMNPTGAVQTNVNQKKSENKESVSSTKSTSKPTINSHTSHTTSQDDNIKAKASVNCSLPEYKNNKTLCQPTGIVNNILQKMSDNSAMLLRTMLVLLGVTSIVIVYFVVRAVRLRRRRSKSRKYGVITRGGDTGDMEMEPLGDGDDDDDDYTVFEMNGRRK